MGKAGVNEITVDSVAYELDTGASFELIAIDGSVWITVQQIASVFEVDRSVIGKHIRNVYSTAELERERRWSSSDA